MKICKRYTNSCSCMFVSLCSPATLGRTAGRRCPRRNDANHVRRDFFVVRLRRRGLISLYNLPALAGQHPYAEPSGTCAPPAVCHDAIAMEKAKSPINHAHLPALHAQICQSSRAVAAATAIHPSPPADILARTHVKEPVTSLYTIAVAACET